MAKATTSPESERERLEFEREKWQAELASRREELDLKRGELNRSRWVNPLVIAIFAAAIAGLGNAAVTLINGTQQTQLEQERARLTQRLNSEQSNATLRLEQSKSEAARILEVVKTNDPDKAAANLSFLIDTGLIADSNTRSQIQAYLEKRKPGQGVSLPAVNLDEYGARWKRQSAERVAKHVQNTAECQSTLQQLGISTVRGAIVTFTGTTGPGILLTVTDEGTDFDVSDYADRNDLGEGYSFVFADGTETPKLTCSLKKYEFGCRDATWLSPVALAAFESLQTKMVSKVKSNKSAYEVAPTKAQSIRTMFACAVP